MKAKEEDQVGPQAQESFHDSSTDSCLTLPYSSDSPRPFPPSPVHSISDSPKRVSPLSIATSNPSNDNSASHSPIVHNLPTTVPSTLPILMPSQTFTPVLFTPTTNSYNTPSYFPFSSSSFPQPGPIVFPGSPPDYPTLEPHSLGLTLPFPTLPPYLPILLDFNPPLGLVLSGVVAEIPGVPILGGEELPEAEDIESLPPPAVRPLPSPAISGLIINQV